MANISIIVPFAGHTLDLIPDLKAATEGAELIIVDNASSPETREALETLNAAHYIRNDTNLGFAAGNNQGYARATGDIVMFLNSDVAAATGWLRAVAADIRPGALYGPSLAQQLIYGMWLPYLEGWCVAATRGTWDKLCQWTSPGYVDSPPSRRGKITRVLADFVRVSGPWDAENYPNPYWEDNDLCLRAMQADISLIQTAWQVQHKGGRTAGPILRHGLSFEQNRATFAARVRTVWEGKVRG